MTLLPGGWVEVPLEQVAESQLGRMLSARRETGEHLKPYLRNRDVQWGHINVDGLPAMDFGPHEAPKFRLRLGDVLVCEGGEVGRAAIWRNQLEECYYQKALHRVRTSPALFPDYLRYLLEHYARASAFERYTSGSTIAHLPQEDLRSLPIPLPPIAEQRRIVAAIDEHFSRLDAGMAALNRARQNIRLLRASTLKAAVAPPDGVDSVYAGSLFNWASGKRLANTDGNSGPIPVFGGNGVTGNTAHVLKQEVTIVIGRVGALCGNVYLTNGPTWVTDNAIYIRSHSEAVELPYAVLILKSANLRERAAGTGQPFLNQRMLNDVKIPLPSKDYQLEIVGRFDAIEYQISRTEDQLLLIQKRLVCLRSALLAEAFAGRLVRQDSSDEPARTLLERLAADHAKSSNQGTARVVRPNSPRERLTHE